MCGDIDLGSAAQLIKTAPPPLIWAHQFAFMGHPGSPQGYPGSHAASPHATPDSRCAASGVTKKANRVRPTGGSAGQAQPLQLGGEDVAVERLDDIFMSAGLDGAGD